MPAVWQTTGAALFLAAVTVAAVRAVDRRPWFMVGWLWYLGTLVPVVGLVQVGNQSMADRYTYLPLVGIFVIAVWGMPQIAARCGISSKDHRRRMAGRSHGVGGALMDTGRPLAEQ